MVCALSFLFFLVVNNSFYTKTIIHKSLQLTLPPGKTQLVKKNLPKARGKTKQTTKYSSRAVPNQKRKLHNTQDKQQTEQYNKQATKRGKLDPQSTANPFSIFRILHLQIRNF